MNGWVASGIMLLVFGVPCIVLGLTLKKDPGANKAKGPKKQQKKRKKPKGASGRQKQDGGGSGKKGEGTGSLIYGGAAFCLLGIGFLVWGLVK